MSIKVKYGTFDFDTVGNAPTVVFDTEINRSAAGYIVGTTDKVKLNGVIFATGSLNNSSNGSNYNDGAWVDLLNNVNLLKNSIQDYLSLTIECGSTKIYESNQLSTIVESINFNNQTDDNWLKIIDYEISLSIPNTGYHNYITDSGYYISDFQDSYSIQTSEDNSFYFSDSINPSNKYPYSVRSQYFPLYTVNRTVSANGIATKNISALDNAKKFVSGLVNNNPKINNVIDNLILLDRSTTINNDSIDGTFSITDNFIAMSGNPASGWIDTFTIDSEVDTNLQRSVNIRGTVKGLNALNIDNLYSGIFDYSFKNQNSGTKYINASGGFYQSVQPRMLTRALQVVYPSATLTGLSSTYSLHTGLNPIPLSVTIDHGIIEGTITYSYSYNSRPLALVSGAIVETLNMDDTFSTRTYNMQDIYLRMPIPQDIGTQSIPARSITYEATFPRPLSGVLPDGVRTQIDNLMKQFNPNKLTPSSSMSNNDPGYFSWLTLNEETYDVIAGKYTRRYSWQYQKALYPNGFYN